VDWGTRRKPLGAIVAWSSLAIFAVMTILGIAGVVMSLQSRPVSPQVEIAATVPEPAPVEERLPEELSFAEVQAAEAASTAVEPADQGADLIASTFEQLVEPVAAPAGQEPETAVATVPETAVDEITAQPVPASRSGITRNAAAWAIESEVPDSSRNIAALGYASQPGDGVRVGDSAINVRSGPSADNKRLFGLEAGVSVEATGKSGDWVAITDEKDRDGWVDASLLENVDFAALPNVKNPPAPEAPAKPSSLKQVASSGVTVRSGPAKGHKALFNLSGGSEVSVLDESKGWLKVQDAEGRTGWAYKSYIR
jgi:SH3-like domain-containing protein